MNATDGEMEGHERVNGQGILFGTPDMETIDHLRANQPLPPSVLHEFIDAAKARLVPSRF